MNTQFIKEVLVALYNEGAADVGRNIDYINFEIERSKSVEGAMALIESEIRLNIQKVEARRKIIQIFAEVGGYEGEVETCLGALCDDGSMWWLKSGKWELSAIPAIPQDEMEAQCE